MNRSLLLGITVGVVVAATAGAIAQRAIGERRNAYAEVITSNPAFVTQRVAREVCRDQLVTRRKQPQDEHRIAGTAIGALVGGVVGAQIGDGDGRAIATVAGAAAGGYAGNRIQKSAQDKRTVSSTEKRCTTVMRDEKRQVGYDIRYRFGETISSVRLEHNPGIGARLPVRDGRVVLTAQTTAKDPERT